MCKIPDNELKALYQDNIRFANLMSAMSSLSDAQDILHEILGLGTNMTIERVITTINHAKWHIKEELEKEVK